MAPKKELSWKDPQVFWGLCAWGVIILWIITSPLRETCQSASAELKDAQKRLALMGLAGESRGMLIAETGRVMELEKKRDRLCSSQK